MKGESGLPAGPSWPLRQGNFNSSNRLANAKEVAGGLSLDRSRGREER